jgi:hypothetical protein
MTVAKILPVRYLGYFDARKGVFDVTKDTSAIELDDANQIKNHIVGLLFAEGPKTVDYLLVTYDTKMYVVERDSDKSYCKREVTYHPLMEKVKL